MMLMLMLYEYTLRVVVFIVVFGPTVVLRAIMVYGGICTCFVYRLVGDEVRAPTEEGHAFLRAIHNGQFLTAIVQCSR